MTPYLTFDPRIWFPESIMTASAAMLGRFASPTRAAVVSPSLLLGLVLTIVGISLPTASG
jgi:hypothetical protein